MGRSVTRTTDMPRPAKPARQTRYAPGVEFGCGACHLRRLFALGVTLA